MIYQQNLLIILFILLLNGCTSVVKQSPEYGRVYKYDQDGMDNSSAINPTSVKQAVPKIEAKSRYGNPKSYSVYGKKYDVLNSAKGYKQRGKSSWYGKKFHGARTSSGETYDMYAMTAAHKTLPLPSYVRVTNLDNQKSLIVRVNDRGPFHQGRIIDLSYSAAFQLGIVSKGTGRVEVEAIDPTQWKATQNTTIKKQADYQTNTLLKSNLFIQVGAFGDINNARALVSKLTHSFKEPVLRIKKRSAAKWLQVVKIGPFSSQLDLDAGLENLIQQGYTSSHQITSDTN